MTRGDVEAVLRGECRAFAQAPQFMVRAGSAFAVDTGGAQRGLGVGGSA
jgi:hypothetical protein